MESLIISTGQIKKISECEVICGEKIYYMTDKTSFSENQIIKITNGMSIFKKKIMLFLLDINFLKKHYNRRLIDEDKKNQSLTKLFSDKEFINKKWEQFNRHFENQVN
jgi:hypothetical protein